MTLESLAGGRGTFIGRSHTRQKPYSFPSFQGAEIAGSAENYVLAEGCNIARQTGMRSRHKQPLIDRGEAIAIDERGFVRVTQKRVVESAGRRYNEIVLSGLRRAVMFGGELDSTGSHDA
jgi:hypothetical protein